MNKIIAEKEFLFLAMLVVIATVLPHPENVTPIAALGIFSGAYMNRKIYLLVPVLASFLTDMTTIGIYNILIMAFVYAGFLLSSVAGRIILFGESVLPRLPLSIIVATLGFYLVSNFGVWIVYYPASLEGLLSCYSNGIPYLGRSLLGNVIYSVLFFGSFELFCYWQKQSKLAHN